MREKCNKFESLYIFRSDAEFKEHIKGCPDCQAEQEKMDKVSELLQEVRPYYIHQSKQVSIRLKVACILFLGLLTCLSVAYFIQLTDLNITENSYYSSESVQNTTTNEYGIPLDSYGLITVN